MNFRNQRVFFPSENIQLEGMLTFPQNSSRYPAIIICHPHPKYGGDMNNNVVMGLSESLMAANFVIFRFNFRGVNLSEGVYDEEEAAITDVIAAASFLKTEAMVDEQRLFLAGYSFGAWVGLQAAVRSNNCFKAIAGISPPLEVYNFDFLVNNYQPIILMSGDRDAFCSTTQLDEIINRISSPKQKNVLSGTDHFYGGREKEAGDLVKDFFCCYL